MSISLSPQLICIKVIKKVPGTRYLLQMEVQLHCHVKVLLYMYCSTFTGDVSLNQAELQH